jgi:hypothetical protein
MSRLAKRIRPDERTIPLIAASVLDLPAPFAPMSAVTAPSAALNEMPWTASTAP